MTNDQERHLNYIKEQFELQVDSKYRKGQEEHGGDLWELDLLSLLDNAIQEAIDQFTYLMTIRQKLLARPER
jgi:hypothetical protein